MVGGDVTAQAALMRHVSELSEQAFARRAEHDRAEGRKTAEDIKAELIRPYANKVFNFVSCYCLSVLTVLLLAGWKIWNFSLSDTILAIISGSTAVSVIGLIGMVISGLFGVTTKAKRSTPKKRAGNGG